MNVICQARVLLTGFASMFLEYVFGIHIVKVLATRAKYLEPSDYCTVTNVFGCFHGIMAKFELSTHKFLN